MALLVPRGTENAAVYGSRFLRLVEHKQRGQKKPQHDERTSACKNDTVENSVTPNLENLVEFSTIVMEVVVSVISRTLTQHRKRSPK